MGNAPGWNKDGSREKLTADSRMDSGSEIRMAQTADPFFTAASDKDALPDVLIQLVIVDVHLNITHWRERCSAEGEVSGFILKQDSFLHDLFLHIGRDKLGGGEMGDEF